MKVPKDAFGSNMLSLVNKDWQSTESGLVAGNRRVVIDYMCHVFMSSPEKCVVLRTYTCVQTLNLHSSFDVELEE